MDELSLLYAEEMKLICLFHNGKVTIVDLLAHFHSNEMITLDIKEKLQILKTSILAIYPKYIEQNPSALEKIRKDLQICITLLPGDNMELLNSIEQILNLGNFIANANEDTYDRFCNGIFTHQDYPDINNWMDFWTINSLHIVNILSYLQNNNAIDSRRYFQKLIEVKTVLLKDSKRILYKVYPEQLKYHYGFATDFESVERYCERWRKLLTFYIQFTRSVFQIKLFNGNRGFDMDLDSEVSEKVSGSIKNLFCDKLGDLNDRRYMVCMCEVDNEYIKLKGKQEGDSSAYNFKIFPCRGSLIPYCYQGTDSPESRKLIDKLKSDFIGTILKNMGQRIGFGLNSWVCNDTYIKSTSYFSKDTKMPWTLDEMYMLDVSIKEATNKFNSEFEDLKITLMEPFYRVETGMLNYRFQVRVYSPGLLEVIEDIIPHVQEVFMDIESY